MRCAGAISSRRARCPTRPRRIKPMTPAISPPISAARRRSPAGRRSRTGTRARMRPPAGAVRVAGTDRAVAFAELARRNGKPLAAEEAFAPQAPTYPNGTHIAEVEIDPETGATEILAYTVVDDFGVTLNPLLLAGQVHG